MKLHHERVKGITPGILLISACAIYTYIYLRIGHIISGLFTLKNGELLLHIQYFPRHS